MHWTKIQCIYIIIKKIICWSLKGKKYCSDLFGCHKGKFSRLDTYYYIKPICKLESGPTKWRQISELNSFSFLLSNNYIKNLIFNEIWTLQSSNFGVIVHKKNVMDSLFIMELKFFHKFETCYNFKGYDT